MPHAAPLSQRYAIPDGAFTLLEVLVSISLSIGIILVAYAGIRTASRSVREVQRLSLENELIASGWMALSHEADYWTSHASPEYPYLKSALAEPVEFKGTRDNPWDKRPFRRVDWSTVIPDASHARAMRSLYHLTANEPGSWYRAGYVPDALPTARLRGQASIYNQHGQRLTEVGSGELQAPQWLAQWSPYAFYLTGTDPTTNAYNLNFEENGWFMPAGWDPWHVAGSYSDIENVTSNDPGKRRQGAHWAVFKELGHLGVASYMPAGSPNIVLRPSDNRKPENIGVLEKWYDWGEIPWSLTFGNESGMAGYSPTHFRVPSSAQIPDAKRGNLIIGNFCPSGPVEAVARIMRKFNNSSEQAYGWFVRPPSLTSSGLNPFLLVDTERALRRYRGESRIDAYSWSSPEIIEPCIPYPTRGIYRPDQSSKPFDTDTLMDGLTIDPVRSLYPGGDNAEYQVASLSRTESLYTIRTYLQPQLHSDATTPDIAQLPVDGATLQVGVLRYRAQGGDRTAMTILVENPRSGSRVEVPFTLLGSSFRGARQHWGWKTRYDRPDLPPMGDIHEP